MWPAHDSWIQLLDGERAPRRIEPPHTMQQAAWDALQLTSWLSKATYGTETRYLRSIHTSIPIYKTSYISVHAAMASSILPHLPATVGREYGSNDPCDKQ